MVQIKDNITNNQASEALGIEQQKPASFAL